MTRLLELVACLPAILVCAWLLLGVVRSGRAARKAAKRLGGTVVNFTYDGVAVIHCPDTPSTKLMRATCERELGVRIKVV